MQPLKKIKNKKRKAERYSFFRHDAHGLMYTCQLNVQNGIKHRQAREAAHQMKQ